MKLLRNSLITAAAFITLFTPFAAAPLAFNESAKGEYIVYVGTYTGRKSKGIYAFRFQPATGSATQIGLVAETANPSFLVLHPDRPFLYAVNEVSNFEGRAAGSVSAFAIDAKTGGLKFMNSVSTRGEGPCHLAVDRTGKRLLVANYGGGSIAAFPINADGSLGEASAFVQHAGSGANPQRQSAPHAHSVNLSPDNRFVFVSDLGLDQVLIYRFDAVKGTLTPNDPAFAKIKPGAGPRHFAFHPNGRFAYVINEMDSSVTAFSYQASGGALREMQTVSTLPADFRGNSSTAEIEVHRNGKFLYGSNRGHDSIAVFAVDPRNGALKPVDQTSTGGKTPRNFSIDPTGAFLFAANQNSDNVNVFRIDQQTGKPVLTGQTLEVPTPVCVAFFKAE